MRFFGKKEEEDPGGTGEGEPKKTGFKTYLIIGIVVIVIIAAIAIPKIKNAPALAVEGTYTLVEAEGNITALVADYAILAAQVAKANTDVAKAASDISGINSRISGISTDWGPTISALQNTQQSLQSSFAILSGNVTTLAGNLTAFTGNTTAGNGTTFNFTGLNTSVATLTTTVNNLASQLTSLNTKVIELATNQTAGFDEHGASIVALNTTVNNLTTQIYSLTIAEGNYARVTDVQPGVDSNIAWITVHGSGDFPVIVSFYGSNLTDTGTIVFAPYSSCTLTHQYLYGTTMLASVIEPATTWLDNGVIMVMVTKGTIDYATAVIGGS